MLMVKMTEETAFALPQDLFSSDSYLHFVSNARKVLLIVKSSTCVSQILATSPTIRLLFSRFMVFREATPSQMQEYVILD